MYVRVVRCFGKRIRILPSHDVLSNQEIKYPLQPRGPRTQDPPAPPSFHLCLASHHLTSPVTILPEIGSLTNEEADSETQREAISVKGSYSYRVCKRCEGTRIIVCSSMRE